MGNRTVFYLSGDLNEANCSNRQELLERSRGSSSGLVLNLSRVSRLDLRGLTWMFTLERQLKQRGQKLSLLQPSREVQEVLRQLHPALRPRLSLAARQREDAG